MHDGIPLFGVLAAAELLPVSIPLVAHLHSILFILLGRVGATVEDGSTAVMPGADAGDVASLDGDVQGA